MGNDQANGTSWQDFNLASARASHVSLQLGNGDGLKSLDGTAQGFRWLEGVEHANVGLQHVNVLIPAGRITACVTGLRPDA